MNWQPKDLIAFERRVADAFAAKQCKGPVHLSGGNESQLIEIFKDINREDWVFSTYRSHYHALLHGIDPEWLFQQILDGHSMNIMSPEHRFFTSAIVGGCLPIAVGVAAAIAEDRKQFDRRWAGSVRATKDHSKVWCFVGDMCATTGDFHNAHTYAASNKLPIVFVIESNQMSCDTPTSQAWGGISSEGNNPLFYEYKRIYPHVGIGHNVF